jgi:hypothetical protein
MLAFLFSRGAPLEQRGDAKITPQSNSSPRNSQNVCGRKDDGRTEMGKNWTKGKGKNSQRK